jgi:hypothetical protein
VRSDARELVGGLALSGVWAVYTEEGGGEGLPGRFGPVSFRGRRGPREPLMNADERR